MLKTLYDHFVILYDNILKNNPTLAAEHALKQEEEVYGVSNKLTYRNVRLSHVKFSQLSHANVGRHTIRSCVEKATEAGFNVPPISWNKFGGPCARRVA